MSEFRVTQVQRIAVGDDTKYISATEASEAAHRLNVSHPKQQYAIAHVSYPLDPSPQQVIEAVRALNAEHHDLAAVAWETGTTALAVFSWDSTAVVRYVLSDDLTEVISSDRVRKPKRKNNT